MCAFVRVKGKSSKRKFWNDFIVAEEKNEIEMQGCVGSKRGECERNMYGN